jgi:Putative Flp pilus-assembly TadE/G-like
MNIKTSNSEKGQAIVYLVIGFVVFLGFVALAIDGGMVLSDRRNDQNAADAASLAGGAAAALHFKNNQLNTCDKVWTCTNNSVVNNAEVDAWSKAIDRAQANGFKIVHDDSLTGNNGVKTECGGTTWDDGHIDVTVAISATTPSNFLQIIYPKALHNEVSSVTRVNTGGPYIFGNAIVGLNGGNCSGGNGVTVNGTASTIVHKGNIFSNGCIQGNGTKGSAGVDDGYTISGHFKDPGNITFTPDITISSQTITESEYHIDTPDCTTWYDKLPSTLTPGLYCMTGNLDFKPGDKGYGVTFYVPNGTVSANGNAKDPIELYAPSTDTTSPGYITPTSPYNGLLFIVPNGGAVTLNGTSVDRFHGLIYAPKSQVTLTGTADNIFWGQVVGWDVKVGGNNDMAVNYEGCSGYIRPPSIELYR